MQDDIKTAIEKNRATIASLASNKMLAAIEKAASIAIGAIKKGGKLIVFGNGGSAADSQHMAAELVGRFKKERKALPAIALTTNSSILTALANDYDYGLTFARQVEALGKAGDVAIGISTSGKAANVIDAIAKAKKLGLTTIGLTGKDGGHLKDLADLPIVVESDDTPRIQEAHILIIHVLCELIEAGAA
ncbi:MAG: D-sedoheptulose 7-phosphate isomerase [Candidatus Omnitrophica bacterium]|nr:D-sedoheptulose 7-phosphate isomerase [Candidatus Omnitrophota bacterium]